MNNIIEKCVQSQKVPDFLYKRLGKYSIKFENLVYTAIENYDSEYNGGSWNFYDLSNGGLYMSPDEERTYILQSPNGYTLETTSRCTVGVIASLFALSELNFIVKDIQLYNELMPELYWHLKYFSHQLEDRSRINKFID